MEKLLSAREAAVLLGVRVSTIYGWVKTGRLPVVRSGAWLRFLATDLAQWVERHRLPARDPLAALFGEEAEPDAP